MTDEQRPPVPFDILANGEPMPIPPSAGGCLGCGECDDCKARKAQKDED